MATEFIADVRALVENRLKPADTIIVPLGGQFLLDPNEINGWGITGPTDDSNTVDLGNSNVTNLSRFAGGYCWPFAVRLKRMFAWHYNSNTNAQAWGWVVSRQAKTAGNNTVVTTNILHEVNAGNLRNYGNNLNQNTDIAFNDVIPANEVLNLAVGSPTAVTTNRYVRILAGYFELERVF